MSTFNGLLVATVIIVQAFLLFRAVNQREEARSEADELRSRLRGQQGYIERLRELGVIGDSTFKEEETKNEHQAR